MDKRKDIAYVYPNMPSNQEMLAVLMVLNTICGSKCISLDNNLLCLYSMDKQAHQAVLFRNIGSQRKARTMRKNCKATSSDSVTRESVKLFILTLTWLIYFDMA